MTSESSSPENALPRTCKFPSILSKVQDDYEACIALNKKGTAFAVLTASNLCSSSQDFEIDHWTLRGSVKLRLQSAQSIRSVEVSVQGQIVTKVNATRNFTFLDVTKTLWSKKENLIYPSPPQSAIIIKRSQNMIGDHEWPFVLSLPRRISLPDLIRKHHFAVFQLPHSFNERNTPASIQYSLCLRFTRGRFRPDNVLRIALAYPPVSDSEFFSFHRQSFFDTPSLLRWPDEDPEAWYTHRSVAVARKLNYHSLPVTVKCTLSYARGSVIPFSLEIEAAHEQVLDMLSSPNAPVLRLRRRVKCEGGASIRFHGVTQREAIDHSDLAIWWPSPHEPPVMNRRRLSGELQIHSDMKPTTTIAHFSIKYSVVLLSFDAISFTTASIEPLALVDVEIL
ncbi:hypothetical protein H0H93_000178 [Arthromyces matolae]|nr:hypothetical protein H0H93_000178 [Arthromyces matolae]